VNASRRGPKSHANDAAARPGPYGKPPCALYSESDKERVRSIPSSSALERTTPREAPSPTARLKRARDLFGVSPISTAHRIAAATAEIDIAGVLLLIGLTVGLLRPRLSR
jgi:hypothetical protein